MSNDNWNEDVDEVIETSLSNDQINRLIEHNATLRDVYCSVFHIKGSIAEGDLEMAKEAWSELSEEEQNSLYVAPKFGGIFTTKERGIIKKGFKE